MSRENIWRFTLVGTVLSVLPVLIVLRMLQLQIDPKQRQIFGDQRDYYSWEMHTVFPARGQIFDRWGHPLAANQMVYEVAIDLQQVKNPHSIAVASNVVLGLDYNEVLTYASQEPSDEMLHVVIADNITPEKVDSLRKYAEQIATENQDSDSKTPPSLRGMVFSAHLMRTYPEKSLASNILGFVMRDGKGYFGVEEKYNEMLAGKSKTIRRPLDPNRAEESPVVPDGASLILTIDREIQAEMEKIVDQAIDETGSESGTIVIIAPKTGEILALAQTPRLDLNEYWGYQEIFTKNTPFNRGVSESYEPGSVYKVLTMAAAFDKGVVKPETEFLDTGIFEIGGTYIYNWNQGAWGPQTMLGCMQHSLNVCLAWVATQIGAGDFYRYMQAFNIGRLTGVDMAGEAPGRLKSPGDDDWYDADLGTNSFGQGVSATPIQMAAAASAIANGGKMMTPHVVRSIVNKGFQRDVEIRLAGSPIGQEAADNLTEVLANSLEIESSDALVTGYRVAGKTGTAEIPTAFGYTSNETNASFVGWGPVDDPQFLVYVWLEKPSSSVWGSVVAAPVFRQVVEKLVVLMNIPPDEVRLQLRSQ